MIELKNVFKTYKSKKGPNTEALKNININFDNKGMTFVLGKSGSGKSTLLNLLGGLDTPTSGEIYFNGKKLNSFKSKDYDNYRSNYIGFVFQDYNLLEKYNVYENVAFPLKIQQQNDYDNKVLEVLDRVGLKDLKDRKINELSGGQKQRVAIARALVKSPNVILADEPTGNLDSESSKGIFNLLKELSNNILVIIISHDEENAKIYGDRILYIKDGEIVAVTSNVDICENLDLEYKRNKLSIKDIFYIAFKNLFSRKGKLILSLILISISLSLFGLSVMQKYIKDKEETVRLLGEYNAKFIMISKIEKSEGVYCNTDKLTRNCDALNNLEEDDYKKLTQLYPNIEFKKAYYYMTSGTPIKLIKSPMLDEKNQTYMDVFTSYNYNMFIELDKNEFDFKLIGRKPNNYEEIVISKLYADYIIRNGTYLYEEEFENSIYNYLEQRDNSMPLGKRKIYKPSSYEEIINDDYHIAYGFGKVKIVGIIDDDMSKYEKYLNMNYKDYMTWSTGSDINELSLYRLSNIFVLKGFKENFDLKIKNSKNVEYKYKNNTQNIILEEDKINEYDLKDNEIIVPISHLDLISQNEYTKKLNEYVISNMDIDSSFGSEYYKKIFLEKYLDENNVIGSSIFTSTGTGKDYKSTSYTIKDVLEIDNYIVSSNSFNNSNIEFITYVETNNKKDIEKIVSSIPLDESEYVLNNEIINMVETDSYPMKVISVYIFVIALFLSLFAMLQLFNYVNTTIIDNKKEIGILRSLGASKIDVIKIYVIMSSIVGIISYIIAMSLCYLYSMLENQMFFSNMKSFKSYNVRLVGIVWQSALIMFLFVLILVLISSISTSNKIAKLKPIDSINDK